MPSYALALQDYSSVPLSFLQGISFRFPVRILLDIVDNDFLAFCSTGSMLAPRWFSSLSASKMLSTNIGMSLGQRRRQMQFQNPAQWLSMPSPDGSC
jgi:hypothetical protein